MQMYISHTHFRMNILKIKTPPFFPSHAYTNTNTYTHIKSDQMNYNIAAEKTKAKHSFKIFGACRKEETLHRT